MEPEVVADIEVERLDRVMRGGSNEVTLPQRLPAPPHLVSLKDEHIEPVILAQVSQLATPAKLALINRLLTQLEPQQIQMVIESGLQTINDHQQRQTAVVSTVSPNTRLVLKKDYTYQDRGLTQPTQYYVYLRRCKPKLDRYIGTLFYVPQGCTLSYFLDTDGRIMFNPPHHIFQLRDYDNATNVQVVRLIGLEPPPIDYTFTKQQKDTPAIYLHLEFLDPHTHQAIAQEKLAFPACMHEGGRLDRYRWEVSTVLSTPDGVTVSPDITVSPKQPQVVNPPPLVTLASPQSHLDRFDRAVATLSEIVQPEINPLNGIDNQHLTKPGRRILELPKAKAPSFYLGDRDNTDIVLKRLRLWATWSEKAMPQAKWAVIQEGSQHILINAHSQRQILKFSPDQAAITLENTLPVLMKWFHDLGLAVSQTQNHRRYSVTQLKLARNLFVDMSLPQTDPLHVLKKLFGVDFTEP
jgi:hypothetical protein